LRLGILGDRYYVAEVGAWSWLLPTGNQGEVISILSKQILV
jgi:hypothetical protein